MCVYNLYYLTLLCPGGGAFHLLSALQIWMRHYRTERQCLKELNTGRHIVCFLPFVGSFTLGSSSLFVILTELSAYYLHKSSVAVVSIFQIIPHSACVSCL